MADGTGFGGVAEDVLPPLNWTIYATNTPLRDSKYGESTPAAKVNFRTIDGDGLQSVDITLCGWF